MTNTAKGALPGSYISNWAAVMAEIAERVEALERQQVAFPARLTPPTMPPGVVPLARARA